MGTNIKNPLPAYYIPLSANKIYMEPASAFLFLSSKCSHVISIKGIVLPFLTVCNKLHPNKFIQRQPINIKITILLYFNEDQHKALFLIFAKENKQRNERIICTLLKKNISPRHAHLFGTQSMLMFVCFKHGYGWCAKHILSLKKALIMQLLR